MQNNGIIFTSYEAAILQDTAFLPAKRAVMDKTAELWEELGALLQAQKTDLKAIERRLDIRFQAPRVTKGDNYRELPYAVLDYLRHFGKESTFTFRAMLWWGHFFSFTLHIGGKAWQQLATEISADRLALALPAYISVGDDPWEYHYEPDNYAPLQPATLAEQWETAKARPFVKISRQLPVTTPPDVVFQEGLQAYLDFMSLLK